MPLHGPVRVPAEEAAYRLEPTSATPVRLFGLSTYSSSVWTLHPATAAGSAVLPPVDVDYTDVVGTSGAGLLDLANTAPDRVAAALVLRAGHQDGACAPACGPHGGRLRSHDHGAAHCLCGPRLGAPEKSYHHERDSP